MVCSKETKMESEKMKFHDYYAWFIVGIVFLFISLMDKRFNWLDILAWAFIGFSLAQMIGSEKVKRKKTSTIKNEVK